MHKRLIEDAFRDIEARKSPYAGSDLTWKQVVEIREKVQNAGDKVIDDLFATLTAKSTPDERRP